MRVGEICTRNVVFCTARTSVLEVAQLMRSSHVGDVVVVEQTNGERVPIGILTDRNLVIEVMAKEVDAATLAAGEVMTPDVVTASESESMHAAIDTMRDNGVRRIPVINDTGGLAGIGAMDDLVRALAEEFSTLGKIVSRGQFKEGQSRR